MFYIEQYALNYAMELAHALIGATAIISKTALITGNDKHYKHIPGLEIQKFNK